MVRNNEENLNQEQITYKLRGSYNYMKEGGTNSFIMKKGIINIKYNNVYWTFDITNLFCLMVEVYHTHTPCIR